MTRKLLLSTFVGTLAIAGSLAYAKTFDAWPFSAPVVASEGSVSVPSQGNIIFDYDSGSDGIFKGYNGTSWVEFGANAVPNLDVRAVTSTDTATTSDDVLLLSGSSFTEGLYSASGNTGKVIEIVHGGTSLTQVYTIDAASSELIGSGLTYALYTNGEKVKLMSNGTNWVVLEHFASTGWVDAGALNISSTGGTQPDKSGTTRQIDKMWWRRVGANAEFRYEFNQDSGSGGTAGLGDYLFTLPSNMIMDTTYITLYNTAEGGGGAYANRSQLGSANLVSSDGDGVGFVSAYDSTHVRLFYLTGQQGSNSQIGAIGGAVHDVAGAAGYFMSFSAPISGWQP